MFDPPLDSIEHGVLTAFDAIVLRSADIDDITTKVSRRAAAADLTGRSCTCVSAC